MKPPNNLTECFKCLKYRIDAQHLHRAPVWFRLLPEKYHREEEEQKNANPFWVKLETEANSYCCCCRDAWMIDVRDGWIRAVLRERATLLPSVYSSPNGHLGRTSYWGNNRTCKLEEDRKTRKQKNDIDPTLHKQKYSPVTTYLNP